MSEGISYKQILEGHSHYKGMKRKGSSNKAKALKKVKKMDKIEKHFGKTHEEMRDYQRRVGRAYSD